ncbi:unnamed protein product [Didymodactylos carnosus]|uniref:NAD(P)(+)--arginine ADP-ribosyltransferase n=1 Tax=Didymodactylos carnosus TaxID=1234261 RepID=A0A814W064_9BILA|nr:unnamed protein product [Didymodactylos carnosus]CAF1197485.1 unnamed protein product [Didymodactylos carnosus]CAF3613331.1 unnamed protein product [Didymodactylos carnosus]CAF3961908.1 unnamed protein product [Didymodactylos carnosus]
MQKALNWGIIRMTSETTHAASRSFVCGEDYGISVLGVISKEFHLPYFKLEDISARRIMVEKAAEGLIIEGKLIGKERDAEWMALQLLRVKNGCEEEVWKLNEIRRLLGDEIHNPYSKTKVPTFGPFALLFYELRPLHHENTTLYRGCQLSDDLIERYRQVSTSGLNIFQAFTSTSRNKEAAECFGNVLMEIDIDSYVGIDLSLVSVFPDEEEVLLFADFYFYVQSCVFDNVKKKWIIRIKSA